MTSRPAPFFSEALHRQAPLLTRDRILRASTQLATIW